MQKYILIATAALFTWAVSVRADVTFTIASIKSVLYHSGGGDLNGSILNNLVGRNWQTRMLYQTDSNVWIGM